MIPALVEAVKNTKNVAVKKAKIALKKTQHVHYLADKKGRQGIGEQQWHGFPIFQTIHLKR